MVSIKDHLLQLEQLHINGVDTVCFLDEMHIAITEETIRYL